MRCLDIEVKVKTKTLNRLIGLWCWREWCIDVNLKIKIEVCRLKGKGSALNKRLARSKVKVRYKINHFWREGRLEWVKVRVNI